MAQDRSIRKFVELVNAQSKPISYRAIKLDSNTLFKAMLKCRVGCSGDVSMPTYLLYSTPSILRGLEEELKKSPYTDFVVPIIPTNNNTYRKTCASTCHATAGNFLTPIYTKDVQLNYVHDHLILDQDFNILYMPVATFSLANTDVHPIKMEYMVSKRVFGKHTLVEKWIVDKIIPTCLELKGVSIKFGEIGRRTFTNISVSIKDLDRYIIHPIRPDMEAIKQENINKFFRKAARTIFDTGMLAGDNLSS